MKVTIEATAKNFKQLLWKVCLPRWGYLIQNRTLYNWPRLIFLAHLL